MAKKGTRVNNTAEMQNVDFSGGRVSHVKILAESVEVVVRIGQRDYNVLDKVHRPLPQFMRTMRDLAVICESVLASKNEDDVVDPYTFNVGYGMDGEVQYLQLGAKIQLASTDHRTVITVNYPKLYVEGEGSLGLGFDHQQLLDAAKKQALRFVIGHYSNPDLFADPPEEPAEAEA